MVETIKVGIQRMGQLLTAALMFALFPGIAVAESAESWQGKEPYEILDAYKRAKWANKMSIKTGESQEPCMSWIGHAHMYHSGFSKEDHKDPQSHKENMLLAHQKGSLDYKLAELAIDSTLAGKSIVEVGKLVWDKCKDYEAAGYVDFKDPNPKKRE